MGKGKRTDEGTPEQGNHFMEILAKYFPERYADVMHMMSVGPLSAGWVEDETSYAPESDFQISEEAYREIVELEALQYYSNSATIVKLEEIKSLPEVENSYYILEVPPKFLTSNRDGDMRKYIFDTFKVVSIVQGFLDEENTTPAAEVRILLTGKSNPAYRDRDTLMFTMPDRKHSEVPLKDISPLKRIDAGYYVNTLDPTFEYFSLEKAAEDIRVGYKPPKPSEDGHGSQIQMLAPENINEIGEVVGEINQIITEKRVNTAPLRTGDLVIVGFGGNVKMDSHGNIGYGAVIDDRISKGNCYVNHFMFKVKLRPEYDPYYVLFALGEEYVRQQVRRLVKPTGDNQLIMTKDFISEIQIRKLDNMSEIGQQYRKALSDRRKAYESIVKLRS